MRNAVLAREKNRPAKDRIEWLLLTTHAITTRSDVLAVVTGELRNAAGLTKG